MLDKACDDPNVIRALDLGLLLVARDGGGHQAAEVAAFVRGSRILQLDTSPTLATSLLSLGLSIDGVATSLVSGDDVCRLLRCACTGCLGDHLVMAANVQLSKQFICQYLARTRDASSDLLCTILLSAPLMSQLLLAARSSSDPACRARFVMAAAFWVGARRSLPLAPDFMSAGHQHDVMALQLSSLLPAERQALIALMPCGTERMNARRASLETRPEWMGGLDTVNPPELQCLFKLCARHPAELELHYLVYRLVAELMYFSTYFSAHWCRVFVGSSGATLVQADLSACRSLLGQTVCFQGVRMLLIALYHCNDAIVCRRVLPEVEKVIRRMGGDTPNMLMAWVAELLAIYSVLSMQPTTVLSMTASVRKVIRQCNGVPPTMYMFPLVVALASSRLRLYVLELIAVQLLHPMLAACALQRNGMLLEVLDHLLANGLSHMAATPECMAGIVAYAGQDRGDIATASDLLQRLCRDTRGGPVWRSILQASSPHWLGSLSTASADVPPLSWQKLVRRDCPRGCCRLECTNLQGVSEQALVLSKCRNGDCPLSFCSQCHGQPKVCRLCS